MMVSDFFCGDKPAQCFERSTQFGESYKCGSCGIISTLMQDRSCFAMQKAVTHRVINTSLAGKCVNAPGTLKPLDVLLVNDLHVRAELRARGMSIAVKLKDGLQTDIVEHFRELNEYQQYLYRIHQSPC